MLTPRFGRLSGRLTDARLRQVARHIAGPTVLDAGCNIAALVEHLPPGTCYVGLELMPGVVAQNRERYDRCEFVQCDLQEDWPELVTLRRFDHVVLAAVVEHLTAPQSVLAQSRAVLAPGGTVIVTTPHPRARRLHDLGARLGWFSGDASDEHEAFFDRAGLADMALAAGLRIAHYERFQLGLNQVAVMAPRA